MGSTVSIASELQKAPNPQTGPQTGSQAGSQAGAQTGTAPGYGAWDFGGVGASGAPSAPAPATFPGLDILNTPPASQPAIRQPGLSLAGLSLPARPSLPAPAPPAGALPRAADGGPLPAPLAATQAQAPIASPLRTPAPIVTSAVPARSTLAPSTLPPPSGASFRGLDFSDDRSHATEMANVRQIRAASEARRIDEKTPAPQPKPSPVSVDDPFGRQSAARNLPHTPMPAPKPAETQPAPNLLQRLQALAQSAARPTGSLLAQTPHQPPKLPEAGAEAVSGNGRIVAALGKSTVDGMHPTYQATALNEYGLKAASEYKDFLLQLHAADPARMKGFHDAVGSRLSSEAKALLDTHGIAPDRIAEAGKAYRVADAGTVMSDASVINPPAQDEPIYRSPIGQRFLDEVHLRESANGANKGYEARHPNGAALGRYQMQEPGCGNSSLCHTCANIRPNRRGNDDAPPGEHGSVGDVSDRIPLATRFRGRGVPDPAQRYPRSRNRKIFGTAQRSVPGLRPIMSWNISHPITSLSTGPT